MESITNSGKVLTTRSFGQFVLKYIVYIMFIAYFIIYAVTVPSFLTSSNLISILNSSGSMILITIGMTCLLAGGNIDCSTGSILYMGCIVVKFCTKANMPIPVIIILTIFSGALLGLLNGLLVSGCKTYGMLPTMATAFVYKGFGYAISVDSGTLIDKYWAKVSTFSIGGFPAFIIVCLIAAILFQVFFTRTVTGRNIFALGSNQKTAGEKGINVFWYNVLLFVIAGACCGAAAVITSSQVLTASSLMGQSSNIYAILAAIIGGASFYGARGSAFPGAVIGALILSCMSNALVLINADANMFYIVYGSIILILICLDAIRRKSEHKINS